MPGTGRVMRTGALEYAFREPAPSNHGGIQSILWNSLPMKNRKCLARYPTLNGKQMEKTLQSFDKLTAQQREECVRALAKFTGMSARNAQSF